MTFLRVSLVVVLVVILERKRIVPSARQYEHPQRSQSWQKLVKVSKTAPCVVFMSSAPSETARPRRQSSFTNQLVPSMPDSSCGQDVEAGNSGSFKRHWVGVAFKTAIVVACVTAAAAVLFIGSSSSKLAAGDAMLGNGMRRFSGCTENSGMWSLQASAARKTAIKNILVAVNSGLSKADCDGKMDAMYADEFYFYRGANQIFYNDAKGVVDSMTSFAR